MESPVVEFPVLKETLPSMPMRIFFRPRSFNTAFAIECPLLYLGGPPPMAPLGLTQALCHGRGEAYCSSFFDTGVISKDPVPPAQVQQEPSTLFTEPYQSAWTSFLLIFPVLPLQF